MVWGKKRGRGKLRLRGLMVVIKGREGVGVKVIEGKWGGGVVS